MNINRWSFTLACFVRWLSYFYTIPDIVSQWHSAVVVNNSPCAANAFQRSLKKMKSYLIRHNTKRARIEDIRRRRREKWVKDKFIGDRQSRSSEKFHRLLFCSWRNKLHSLPSTRLHIFVSWRDIAQVSDSFSFSLNHLFLSVIVGCSRSSWNLSLWVIKSRATVNKNPSSVCVPGA